MGSSLSGCLSLFDVRSSREEELGLLGGCSRPDRSASRPIDGKSGLDLHWPCRSALSGWVDGPDGKPWPGCGCSRPWFGWGWGCTARAGGVCGRGARGCWEDLVRLACRRGARKMLWFELENGGRPVPEDAVPASGGARRRGCARSFGPARASSVWAAESRSVGLKSAAVRGASAQPWSSARLAWLFGRPSPGV